MSLRWTHLPLAAALVICTRVAAAAEQTKPPAKPVAAEQTKTETIPGGTRAKKPKPVDINSATVAQLKTVPGIDEADAQRIVVNRPYMTRSHLVTKNVLSYETYLALKDYIVAVPPAPPKGNK